MHGTILQPTEPQWLGRVNVLGKEKGNVGSKTGLSETGYFEKGKGEVMKKLDREQLLNY